MEWGLAFLCYVDSRSRTVFTVVHPIVCSPIISSTTPPRVLSELLLGGLAHVDHVAGKLAG